MPQLDPTFFASQVFWLAICCAVLYFFMSRIYLPKIETVYQERESIINNSLKSLGKIKNEIEEIEDDYKKRIEHAYKTSSIMVAQALNDLNEQIAQKKSQKEEDFKQMQKDSDKRMLKLKIQLEKEILSAAEESAKLILQELAFIKLPQETLRDLVISEKNKINFKE